MEGGGIREAYQGAVGLLCIVWLSRFSLSVCRRGFQALLRIRPSSLFMLCGCDVDFKTRDTLDPSVQSRSPRHKTRQLNVKQNGTLQCVTHVDALEQVP